MPEFCTCGAELPADARFCHKCGRPLRSEDLAASAPVSVQPPTPAPAVPSFRNPAAVRAGLIAAVLAALLSSLPLLNLFFVVWWAAAGFLAVYLYRRRTGQPLTVRNGASIGWITGVLTFAIMAVLLTISLALLALTPGGLAETLEQQLSQMGVSEAGMLADALRQPVVIIFSLLFLFGLTAGACTAGGALGASVVGRD